MLRSNFDRRWSGRLLQTFPASRPSQCGGIVRNQLIDLLLVVLQSVQRNAPSGGRLDASDQVHDTSDGVVDASTTRR